MILLYHTNQLWSELFHFQEQLNTQKQRIEGIKQEIARTKNFYSQTLKNLEQISNEIHMKRQGTNLLQSSKCPMLQAVFRKTMRKRLADQTQRARRGCRTKPKFRGNSNSQSGEKHELFAGYNSRTWSMWDL